MTNIMYTHTCFICSVDLISAMIWLLRGEPVKLVGNVMRGTRVGVPGRVHRVLLSTMSTMSSTRGFHSHSELLLRVLAIVPYTKEHFVEALVAP
jgi:hypothetical protein